MATAPAGLKPAPLKTGVAVELTGVHKWYGEFHVLRDIAYQRRQEGRRNSP
jgi:hypothetical protein